MHYLFSLVFQVGCFVLLALKAHYLSVYTYSSDTCILIVSDDHCVFIPLGLGGLTTGGLGGLGGVGGALGGGAKTGLSLGGLGQSTLGGGGGGGGATGIGGLGSSISQPSLGSMPATMPVTKPVLPQQQQQQQQQGTQLQGQQQQAQQQPFVLGKPPAGRKRNA